ncbi:lysosomal protective protein-like [Apostichopus japonicus]|uniref:lysosomal protective protein-like n=1 Tax=Stichopus japonicus TaxID=307972 RepID=UPI003AB70CDC
MFIDMDHSIIAILFAGLLGACTAASNPDAITFLPGLTKQPSFDQYSGYLAATGGKMFHYWLVSSQSKPLKDPLIVWTNGGPGCSSMLGILTENGPFIIQDDGVSLSYNDNSWNKFANVLYIESPAGVGFSYTPDGNVTTSDDEITDDHFTALLDFYKKYPALKSNELFLIGESYSGVYTPLLAAQVLAAIDAKILTGVVFGGFATGNGVTNYATLSNSLVYLLYYHGIIGYSLWDELVQNCCDGPNNCNFYNSTVTECTDRVTQAITILGTSGINPYNILATCAGFSPQKSNGTKFFRTTPEMEIMFRGTRIEEKLHKELKQFPSIRLSESPPCLNYTNAQDYLNNAYVRTALHIKPSLPKWTPCSATVLKNYQRVYSDMAPIYTYILQNLAHKVRLLVYNGDLDTACNFLGNQWFVDGLGAQDEVQWRPWLYFDGSDQIAGFIKEYEKIAFATVKGAGHMAPQDKPIATSLLIQNFVTGKPY